MKIEITKKELIRLITSSDYNENFESTYEDKGWMFFDYTDCYDYKSYQWDLEELEKYSEEELYKIYKTIKEDIETLFEESPEIPTVATLNVKLNKPTPLELPNYEVYPSTFWIDEANEGIFRTNKFQTLQELLDDYELVSEDYPEIKSHTDIKRYQRITKENFIEPKEDAWIII